MDVRAECTVMREYMPFQQRRLLLLHIQGGSEDYLETLKVSTLHQRQYLDPERGGLDGKHPTACTEAHRELEVGTDGPESVGHSAEPFQS